MKYYPNLPFVAFIALAWLYNSYLTKVTEHSPKNQGKISIKNFASHNSERIKPLNHAASLNSQISEKNKKKFTNPVNSKRKKGGKIITKDGLTGDEARVGPGKNLLDNLLSNGHVLSIEERSSEDGYYRYKTKLIKSDFKYPYILLEETFANNSIGNSHPIVARKAMVADHILVKLRSGTDYTEVLKVVNQKFNARIVRKLSNSDSYIVKFNEFDITTVSNALASYNSDDSPVNYAEPDYLVQISNTPNDPRFKDQWSINGAKNITSDRNKADMKISGGWAIGTGSRSITVAVLDTGVDYFHQDLTNNIRINFGETGYDNEGNDKSNNGIDDDMNGYVDDIYGWNFYNNDNDPMDDNRHGTHVAGIIGAEGNNQTGITGICWNISLLPIKFLNSRGIGTTSDAIDAINYCVKLGVDIANNSWGGSEYSYALKEAIYNANENQCMIVAAAGNDGKNIDIQRTYPASYDLPNIISVGATNADDELAWFSNYGSNDVDLAAPGVGILSTFPNNRYGYLDGTSMAAPHVTSVLALLKPNYPELDTVELKNRLLAGTDALANLENKCISGGRLNLYNALVNELIANFDFQTDYVGAPVLVKFSNTSVGTIESMTWDFDDGTPIRTEHSPSHVFEAEGVYNVTLEIKENGKISRKTRSISVLNNYEILDIPFSWIDPSEMTEVSGMENNNISLSQEMPFEFKYYWQSYTSLFIGSNGLLGFLPYGLDEKINHNLPDVSISSPTLFPYWDDLNPEAGGQIFTGVTGHFPNRKFVITWKDVPYFFQPSPPFSFQVVLNETSNDIEFHYLEVNPGNISIGSGRSATIGIQSANGIISSTYSYNESGSLTNSKGLVFTQTTNAYKTATVLKEGYDAYELTFHRGWNLISPPIQPIERNIAHLFRGKEIDDFNYWDGKSDRYHVATELKVNLGYWVYCYDKFNIEIIGNRPKNPEILLSKGWNLVGVTDPINPIEHHASIGSIWSWDPEQQSYMMLSSNDSLVPGYGYWIYAINEFNLGGVRTLLWRKKKRPIA